MANVSEEHPASMLAHGANDGVGSVGISLLYAVKPVELAIRHALDSRLRPIGVGTIPYTALTVLERHDGLTASRWHATPSSWLEHARASIEQGG